MTRCKSLTMLFNLLTGKPRQGGRCHCCLSSLVSLDMVKVYMC